MPRPPVTTDARILHSLLRAGSSFLSGETIATEMGVTRVGIHARLDNLRKQGFEIEAARHRGYRIAKEPTQLHPAWVEALLAFKGREVDLVYHSVIDSTNSEAERLLAAGQETPFVVLADKQTSGRGRMGRIWHSPSEGNVYLTLGYRPLLSPSRMGTFTLWIGAKLVEVLRRETGLPLSIKWPNDILCRGHKVAGLLAEARIDADRMRDCLLGIGLNVNSQPSSWPAAAAKVATSLAAERFSADPEAPRLNLNRLLATVLFELLAAADEFIAGDVTSKLTELWPTVDGIAGQTVAVRSGNRDWRGQVLGINADGALLLKTEDGKTQPFHAGEITLGSEQFSG